jgi:pantothenate kinase-related protein Tda10
MEEQIYQWRLQAEEDMRTSGRPALSPTQVKDFVQRFMPAYYTYLPELYTYGPERKMDNMNERDSIPVLKVSLLLISLVLR